MPILGEACLGAITFCAATYSNDKCGSNGLPLTPNSIKLLGLFQELKKIEHPNLPTYLDLVRGKHERVIIVSEHHRDSLSLSVKSGSHVAGDGLVNVAYQVLSGLACINEHGIVHRNLDTENILLNKQGCVKLSKYGIYHMTGHGTNVSFPIGKPRYMAPEVLSAGIASIGDCGLTEAGQGLGSGPKVDVWSLGICLLEALLGCQVWAQMTLPQLFYKILGLMRSDLHPLDILLREHSAQDKAQSWPVELLKLLRMCLMVSPSKRPLPKELLLDEIFEEERNNQMPYYGSMSMFSVGLRCEHLQIEPFDEEEAAQIDVDHLAERSIQEVYYLWKLAGGDLTQTLQKAGLIKSKKPVMSLSCFVTDDGELWGQQRDQSVLLDDTVIVLSLDSLRERLKDLAEEAYYPLLETDTCSPREHSGSLSLPTSASSTDLQDTAALEIVIRENNVEYQLQRNILFSRLLEAYPYKRPQIRIEARIDIPPLVRGKVWAALLEVDGDVYGNYDSIDKETPTATDRQIEVDVPRCHQYSELLSSPSGHGKFKRILKAWVATHQHYVYWQGLDSLCAPFLYLNFNDEALAYACFTAFIPKYLHKFFLKDNSMVIQEYLAVFSQLIAFHEPELSEHMNEIGFIPDLYAIPWFLTMYAHVFHLHKILHLWDTLLLGNSSFPLCIGVSILRQLKDQLIEYDFNECILLFSDMPEIDIERCVQDSIKIFCMTPKSATYRQHAEPPVQKPRKNSNQRTTQSYYTQEQSNDARLSMDAIPLEELKSEKCPRISAEDLIELCELQGPSSCRTPSKPSRTSKPRILVLDIRSVDEYQRGTVPGSVNMPHITTFDETGQLASPATANILNSQKNLVKVVVGNARLRTAVEFAESLLQVIIKDEKNIQII